MEQIQIGLTGESAIIVALAQTAYVMGSGSLQVFATPAMVALMEAAAVNAVDHLLEGNLSSVGIGLNIQHLSATAIGEEVRAQAEVIDIDGRRITFEVRAWDEHDLIGEGTHTRFIIDVERFLDRLHTK